MAFQASYIYDYVTKLCSQQAESRQNHENGNVRHIGKVEERYIKYKKVKLNSSETYSRSSD
jgi:hypothetical protein